jgi:hypothetical protein
MLHRGREYVFGFSRQFSGKEYRDALKQIASDLNWTYEEKTFSWLSSPESKRLEPNECEITLRTGRVSGDVVTTTIKLFDQSSMLCLTSPSTYGLTIKDTEKLTFKLYNILK